MAVGIFISSGGKDGFLSGSMIAIAIFFFRFSSHIAFLAVILVYFGMILKRSNGWNDFNQYLPIAYQSPQFLIFHKRVCLTPLERRQWNGWANCQIMR